MGLLKSKKLERKKGNFEPVQFYDSKENKKELKESEEDKKELKKSKKTYDYQRASVKVPKSTKKNLDALKLLKKQQFDYEILEMIVDFYVDNLSQQDFKKFKNFKEIL